MIFDIDQKPGDRIAILGEDGASITYGQLKNRITEIGQQLGNAPFRRLVFCMCKNQPETVMWYLAFLHSGIVPLMLDANMNPLSMERLKEIYQPDYILHSDESGEVVLTQNTDAASKNKSIQISDELALLLPTSGSTGSPKFVRLSRENVEANAKSIVEYLKITEEERAISVLPLHYTYGLSVLHSHLLAGASVFLTTKSVLELDFWKQVEENHITSISGVPYTYELLHKLKFTEGKLGSSIRTMTQAGGHLSEELQREFGEFALKTGKKFVVMYGQTEATARMSYLPGELCLEKLGSIGVAIPGGKFQILKEDGSELPFLDEGLRSSDVVGELVYYGTNVSLGYAECREDLAKGDERNGVLYTGDLAYRDADGFFYLAGRKNRFIKLRGNRVSLDACEEILREGVATDIAGLSCEIACVGVEDCLTIYKTNFEIKDLRMKLADKLHMDFRLFREQWVREIPRTSSGKIDYIELKELDPYGQESNIKDVVFSKRLQELTNYHMLHCKEYAAMMESDKADSFVAAGIFKRMSLHSLGSETNLKQISEAGNLRIGTSSGTTGQQTSQVFLDGETRALQQQALGDIVMSFIGPKRLPMLLIDCPSTVSDATKYSARTAGIQGFSMFGRKRVFALSDDMKLDVAAVTGFLEEVNGKEFFIFGFTFLIWEYLCQEVKRKDLQWDMSKAILIHGGGWKKLSNLNISKATFKETLEDALGLTQVYDYYGMAEQAGSIFMECECGHYHASKYSDVLVRNPQSFEICAPKEEGIIQVMSTLPKSYPGHNILTEDIGEYLGKDTCPCGRKGAYFNVLGRMKAADLRGCSDTLSLAQEQDNNVDSRAGSLKWRFAEPSITECQISWDAFAEKTLEFLSAWSKAIRNLPLNQLRPDIMAFAFWIRDAHISELKQEYLPENNIVLRGRGVALHFVPSNIPNLFAYSLVSSLLAGNPVVMRMPWPKHVATVTETLIETMDQALEEVPEMKSRISLIQYPHDKVINSKLSQSCALRIVWGGDRAVKEITASPRKEGAKDIVFPNRKSMAVFCAKSILEADTYEMQNLIRSFYADTYLVDQNACSSPSLVCWMGVNAEIALAKDKFWKAFEVFASSQYEMANQISVKKLETAQLLAAKGFGTAVRQTQMGTVVTRVELTKKGQSNIEEVLKEVVPGGFFVEMEELPSANGILTILQSATVYGFSNADLKKLEVKLQELGVTRTVEPGHALDFDLNWDGKNLLLEQCK